VTLNLRPQLSTLTGFTTFQFSGSTQPTTAAADGGGSGGPIIIGGDTSNQNQNGFVQQPNIQLTELNSTVTVPDGGTLLLSGQTVAGEVEIEAGVPILSKIPFLKRAFTNRSYAKDEQVLLILVKPTIIIHREVERKQFPLMTSK